MRGAWLTNGWLVKEGSRAVVSEKWEMRFARDFRFELLSLAELRSLVQGPAEVPAAET